LFVHQRRRIEIADVSDMAFVNSPCIEHNEAAASDTQYSCCCWLASGEFKVLLVDNVSAPISLWHCACRYYLNFDCMLSSVLILKARNCPVKINCQHGLVEFGIQSEFRCILMFSFGIKFLVKFKRCLFS
jgi:hypothetical protein